MFGMLGVYDVWGVWVERSDIVGGNGYRYHDQKDNSANSAQRLLTGESPERPDNALSPAFSQEASPGADTATVARLLSIADLRIQLGV